VLERRSFRVVDVRVMARRVAPFRQQQAKHRILFGLVGRVLRRCLGHLAQQRVALRDGVGKVRVDPDRRVEIGERLVGIADLPVGEASHVVRLGIFWLDPNGRAVVGDGLVDLVERAIGIAPVVERLGVLRVERDRLAVILDGAVVLLLAVIAEAEAEIGLGVFRIEADRGLEILDRAVVLAGGVVGEPAPVIRGDELRIDRDRPVEFRDRLVGLAVGDLIVAARDKPVGEFRVKAPRRGKIGVGRLLVAEPAFGQPAVERGLGEPRRRLFCGLDHRGAGGDDRALRRIRARGAGYPFRAIVGGAGGRRHESQREEQQAGPEPVHRHLLAQRFARRYVRRWRRKVCGLSMTLDAGGLARHAWRAAS